MTLEIVQVLQGMTMSNKRLTAQEIMERLIADPTEPVGLPEILANLPKDELRLLLEKLPEVYSDLNGVARRRNFSSCFRKAFDLASKNVKRSVMKKMVVLLSIGRRDQIDTYIRAFFRAPDLMYSSNNDADLIKKQVFAMAQRDAMPVVLRGIRRFLRPTDIPGFLSVLMDLFRQDDMRGEVIKLFRDEWGDMDDATQRTLRTGLKRWMERFQNEGRSDLAGLLLEEFDLYDRPPIPVEIYP